MTKSELIEALIETGSTEENYGLPVFTIGGCEYAIGTDEEATDAAKECIKNSVWAFNADFLACHIEALNDGQINALRGDSCEDCNDALVALLDDFDEFADAAISADGRGHFISHYDGEEVEEGEYFIYRVN